MPQNHSRNLAGVAKTVGVTGIIPGGQLPIGALPVSLPTLHLACPTKEVGGLGVAGGFEEFGVVCADFSGAPVDERGDGFLESGIVDQVVDRGVSGGFVLLSHGAPLRPGVG